MAISLTYTKGYLPPPNCITEYAEDGEKVEWWDGTTLYQSNPSKSSSEMVSVVGDGTAYPVGFSLEELMQLYWRAKQYKVTIDSGTPGSKYSTQSWGSCYEIVDPPSTYNSAEDTFYVYVDESYSYFYGSYVGRVTGSETEKFDSQGNVQDYKPYDHITHLDLSDDDNLFPLKVCANPEAAFSANYGLNQYGNFYYYSGNPALVLHDTLNKGTDGAYSVMAWLGINVGFSPVLVYNGEYYPSIGCNSQAYGNPGNKYTCGGAVH
jgi:hypothetical protein